ncbi:NOT2 family protein [Emericellopsis cladophorae]|uniref:NOT2 family protein n=1 Tax=Emericellopsis cladophorae TaxID=2686198 RepID=A0A9P9Y8A9_9HYPO|nr:NOT2 family protein [Emericellopsis cladophorae]KAI6785140.1 NOT2 family protein [Emericellopsis cladophorae]
MASTQGGFRFGGHGSAQAASQQGQSGGPDEFPPLNRGGNGELGSDRTSSEAKDTKAFDAPAPIDPLNGMSDADKWGIKGLRTLMNNYPDYHAMVVGLDPASLGLDVTSPEPISTQVYSLFDEAPPRPTVNGAKPRLPDCYNVTNVQPIETKIQGFNEETLFWIFYSCPQDIKQQMAAEQLWHKKHQIWLTKDEQMTPQILSPTHERGYYIVWDTNNWRKDRKEFTLYYNDLDTSLTQASGP